MNRKNNFEETTASIVVGVKAVIFFCREFKLNIKKLFRLAL